MGLFLSFSPFATQFFIGAGDVLTVGVFLTWNRPLPLVLSTFFFFSNLLPLPRAPYLGGVAHVSQALSSLFSRFLVEWAVSALLFFLFPRTPLFPVSKSLAHPLMNSSDLMPRIFRIVPSFHFFIFFFF